MPRAYSVLLTCIALAGALNPASVGAQATTTLDEGTFRITIDGTDVGTETFTIKRVGVAADALIDAAGRVSIDARPDLITRLRFSAETLRAADYQMRIESSPAEVHSGRVTGRRVTARVVSSAGENLREYLVSEGAEVIDESVAHQHYFLARRVRNGETRIPVISPRQGKQHFVQVEFAGEETLTIGGQAISARKLMLRPEQGDPRTIWTDAEDRILRLEIPASRLVAERTAPPA
jgi:hypothetical protein